MLKNGHVSVIARDVVTRLGTEKIWVQDFIYQSFIVMSMMTLLAMAVIVVAYCLIHRKISKQRHERKNAQKTTKVNA